VPHAATAAGVGLPRESGDLPGFSRQLKNVQPRIGPIDDVYVAAIVDLDIVGLDRNLAAILPVDLDAALVGLLSVIEGTKYATSCG